MINKVFILLLIILICALLFLNFRNRNGKFNIFGDKFTPASFNYIEKRILDKCQVPTLPGDKCFFTEYNECPRYNGSYLQCTNNYIPVPNQNNCLCNNRTFEMCPKPFKISPKCYYNNL